jgi:hypothetical protein
MQPAGTLPRLDFGYLPLVSRSGRGVVAAVLATAFLASHARAQTSPAAGAAPDIRMDMNVVNVLCTERTRRGAYLSDLGKGSSRSWRTASLRRSAISGAT